MFCVNCKVRKAFLALIRYLRGLSNEHTLTLYGKVPKFSNVFVFRAILQDQHCLQMPTLVQQVNFCEESSNSAF